MILTVIIIDLTACFETNFERCRNTVNLFRRWKVMTLSWDLIIAEVGLTSDVSNMQLVLLTKSYKIYYLVQPSSGLATTMQTTVSHSRTLKFSLVN